MPYIKPEYRPAFDYATSIGLVNKDEIVKAVVKALSFMKLEEIDGCLNYFITKIIMNKEVITEEEGYIIRSVITAVFNQPDVQYFKINRFKGLITSIVDELIDRRWSTLGNLCFLANMKNLYHTTFVRPYEDQKIKETGDLE